MSQLLGDLARWSIISAVVALLVGCGSGEPASPSTSGPQTQSTPATTTQSGSASPVNPGTETLWSFDKDPTGSAPEGTEIFSGTWEVRPESDAPSTPNALCQTGEAEFPALVLGGELYTDLMLSTKFKPISGKQDQAAGLIFRVQDKDNYYIVRTNALEGNVNIYKYANGRRSVIKEGSANVASGQWQELRVQANGNSIQGFLDNQLVVEATDDTYQVGKVGLWTKADSVSCFDNVLAEATQ